MKYSTDYFTILPTCFKKIVKSNTCLAHTVGAFTIINVNSWEPSHLLLILICLPSHVLCPLPLSKLSILGVGKVLVERSKLFWGFINGEASLCFVVCASNYWGSITWMGPKLGFGYWNKWNLAVTGGGKSFSGFSLGSLLSFILFWILDEKGLEHCHLSLP